MELTKTKFKQTEVGLIPEDWNWDFLGNSIKEMTDFVAAGSFESLRDNVKVFETINYALYVRLYDIRLGLGHAGQKYLDKESYNFLSKSNLYGDEILMANIGANVGETFLMPKIKEKASIAPNMIIIRANNQDVAYDYLFYYIQSNFGRKRLFELIAGSGHPKINKTDLKKLAVLKPPLPEQKAIAQVLSDTDNLIQAIELKLTKKRAIKQGAMQQLLTPKEDWEVKKLGEIAYVEMGQSPSSENYNITGHGLPLIQGNADVKNRRTITRNYTSQITKRCSRGDIIMSVRAPVGEIATASQDACIGRGVCAIRYPNKYLYHCLIFIEPRWAKHSTGSTFDSVSSDTIKKLEIPIPIMQEQTRITTILSDMDTEIAQLEQKLTKYKMLKQGLMQNLLTGKIRLV